MIVTVTETSVLVGQATDLGLLHVETGLTWVALDQMLRASGFGRVDDSGEALLQVEALRMGALADPAAAQDPQWGEGWARMLAYAGTRGWTRENDTVVVAHVEKLYQ